MSDLPPGFRFFPTDEELIVHFLHRKAFSLPCHPDIIIPDLGPRLLDPWELNGKALKGGKHWFFFSHVAAPVTRISPSGYWMPTGERETITSRGSRDVGVKTTLVFYIGEAPHGVKTKWVMHEYQLLDGVAVPNNNSSRTNCRSTSSSMKKGCKKRSDYLNLVICRVYEASFIHVNEEAELSCLDEVFLSLDDLDEISMP